MAEVTRKVVQGPVPTEAVSRETTTYYDKADTPHPNKAPSRARRSPIGTGKGLSVPTRGRLAREGPLVEKGVVFLFQQRAVSRDMATYYDKTDSPQPNKAFPFQ